MENSRFISLSSFVFRSIWKKLFSNQPIHIFCKTILIGYFYCCPQPSQAQSVPIFIDSQLDDWDTPTADLADDTGDGNNLDLLKMQVTNDENHLFIRLELAEEINLTDNQKLTLYLDTDQNAATGKSIYGIGAELEVRFGDRDVFYKLPSGQGSMSLNDLIFRHQPTVTSTIFEMSFDRRAVSNSGQNLFISNGVRLVWKDETGSSGDAMPNNGSTFTYIFDETPTPVFTPINLEKNTPQAVRVLTWNTLQNGLDDLDREQYFAKILKVLQPDIITFNECWDVNQFQVASFMNAAIPLGNFQNWQTVKLDDGNITASRFPISQNWLVLPGQRLTASLIDLPDAVSSTDFLLINAHLRCCGNDFERQREADAFVKFILDAKTPGGVIDLAEGTPFLLSGDLNLVGESQQLTTLLTGEIVNTNQFGPGGPMDWDGSDLTDVISLQADAPFAYTWRNEFSSYPPSRLDFHILSGSVAEVEKAFTLQPESMSTKRLNQYGLSPSDARYASDHLPKVVDLILSTPVSVSENHRNSFLQIFPNPVTGICEVAFETEKAGETIFSIGNAVGTKLQIWRESFPIGKHLFQLDVSAFPDGIYFLKTEMPDGKTAITKLVKR